MSLFHNLKLRSRRTIHKHSDYPKKLKTLGDHLRKARFDRNIQQQEFAKLLGVSTTTANMWEKQEREPNISHFPAIINFLGYDPLYIDEDILIAKIENYRRKHGLTYKQVAKRAGIGKETMYHIIRGGNPRKSIEKKILKLIEEVSN